MVVGCAGDAYVRLCERHANSATAELVAVVAVGAAKVIPDILVEARSACCTILRQFWNFLVPVTMGSTSIHKLSLLV